MPIVDLCSEKLFYLEKEDTLQNAAKLMKKEHIGGVVVVDSPPKNRPVGMVTDRDIVLAILAEGKPVNAKVSDIMNKDVTKVSRETGIAETIEIMESKGVRKMIVVDSNGSACGVVSTDDILELIAREMHGLGNLVRKQLQNENVHEFKRKPLVM